MPIIRSRVQPSWRVVSGVGMFVGFVVEGTTAVETTGVVGPLVGVVIW